MKIVLLLLFVLAAADAQVGQYPGGGYPPGQYPGRYPTGPGIPMPRRGKKTQSKTSKEADKALPNFRGTLKLLDEKSVVLGMDDFRTLEFKRTSKTKFFNEGEEVKTPDFKPGDKVSVECLNEEGGFLTAVNVYREKASAEAKQGKAEDGTVDAWAQGPTEQKPERTTRMSPPRAAVDPDDSGPPKLQRGKRAQAPSRTPAPEPQQTAANLPPPLVGPSPAPPAAAPSEAPATIVVEKIDDTATGGRKEDALIRKTQETALEFTETLPNYVCQQMVARFQSEGHPVSWRALDVVTMEVVYDSGKEDYRNIAINGKAVKKGMEELSGSWSTGEFGTVLVDILSPATAADFRYRRESRVAGTTGKLYEFSVERENSHWTIHAGSQIYRPAYRGSVWIDPKTARVLRIEMQARHFPEDFPMDTVESATDYEYVRLGTTQQFLLPVHAETLSCQRGSSICSRNTIDFRNYKKFGGESTIKFGDVK